MAAVPEQSLPQANEIAQRASVDEWAGRWLSPARFAPYLSFCGGDANRALDLYETNQAAPIERSLSSSGIPGIVFPFRRVRLTNPKLARILQQVKHSYKAAVPNWATTSD